MTDNDIKKSIEWHLNSETNCDECSYKDFKGMNGNCVGKMLKEALDLINRKDEDIEMLNVELVGMRGACNSYKMHYDNAQVEIKRLQESLETLNNVIKNTFLLKAGLNNDIFAEIKSEAIKEFWNKLKSQNTMDRRIISVESGDTLVKEMSEVSE